MFQSTPPKRESDGGSPSQRQRFSIHAPPKRGDDRGRWGAAAGDNVSTTPSEKESDGWVQSWSVAGRNSFNHAPEKGRATESDRRPPRLPDRFQSTPSEKGERHDARNHGCAVRLFQPRPPKRGGRWPLAAVGRRAGKFQSTPPPMGRSDADWMTVDGVDEAVSIHAPRTEESDEPRCPLVQVSLASVHALRKGDHATADGTADFTNRPQFQSTPSEKESDDPAEPIKVSPFFNPRPPKRRGRQLN